MTAAGNNWSATGAVIIIIVICLAGVDQFLAKVESAEIRSTAQSSYSTGSHLLEQGKAGEAVNFLRDAHALERQNPDYELQLIAALTADGKITEAEPLLTDILQREPNDGPANLVAARLTILKGNVTDAEAYYHRAIFGKWPGDGAAHRVSTRMELVDLLARKNQKQELLAELISLEAESPTSGDIQKRLAKLFLMAGAPARAADVYAALIEKDPDDIAAYEGKGDAELEQSRYRAAHETYLGAYLRDPGNASIREHLQTLNTVTGLDPTLRQLTSAEKYRRSIRILEMARDALDQCVAKSPSTSLAPGSDENGQLLKTAGAMIAGKAPAHFTNEAAEATLSLAEKLWYAGTTSCGSGDRNALDLIMKHLSS
jgi:thioredoxin-like negative regulator of GroEL